jgi:hypothetical protein
LTSSSDLWIYAKAAVIMQSECTNAGINMTLLWRVRIMHKAPVSFVISVCPSACISAATTGRISLKFNIGNFYENLLRNSKLS